MRKFFQLSGVKPALAAIALVFCLSALVELLGWRIIDSKATFGKIPLWSYLGGVVRTTAGALALGAFMSLPFMLSSSGRKWFWKYHYYIWGGGVILFLLIMLGLISWAP